VTKIVGIVNVTPDSFSDGGLYTEAGPVAARVQALFREGAHMIDIGAESTRPGADKVSVDSEWERLEPVIETLKPLYNPRQFSVDTRHAEVARRALELWSDEITINDVTGLHDMEMRAVVAKHGCPVVVSHLPAVARGEVGEAHKERIDSPEQVRDELLERIADMQRSGVRSDQIIADPGIGFGKTVQLNHRLLRFAEVLPDFPVMIGYSRKRFIGEDRLEASANVRLGKIATEAGASYLRVHDVAAHSNLDFDF
jgi:dihydropteroate synthase